MRMIAPPNGKDLIIFSLYCARENDDDDNDENRDNILFWGYFHFPFCM